MGHRALIAYERPDGTYNLHYTHWGALNLRLTQAITAKTPFGGDEPNETLQSVSTHLLETRTEDDVEQLLDDLAYAATDVDLDPWAIRLTREEIITEYLDFLHHEAFYVVDVDFDVTAYRTHWFGLQFDCRTIDDAPTIGNGALRTVRWYDGEPVGDGFAQGEFRALKAVTGDMVDRGVFTAADATAYLEQKLKEWIDDHEELEIWTPESSPSSESGRS